MNYVTGLELQALEHGHLVRLAVWAVGSMVIGAAMLGWAPRGGAPGLWKHAGIQSVAWGAVDLLIAGVALFGLAPRDVTGAIALDRFLWLNIGLDVGYAMVGATLIAFGARAPRRPGLIGAGAAIVAQGLALAVLDAYLSAVIVR